jgi:chromosome segregation ATPase
MVKYSIDLWDGFDHLSAKTELGLTVIKDVTDFIKKRAAIEAEYGKKLQDLCKTLPGSGVFSKSAPIEKELKTLKGALLSWQEEGTKIATHHLEFANKINTEVVKPLEAFVKAKEPERKKSIAEGQKRITAYQAAKANLEKTKKEYLTAMKEAESATEAHEKAKADLEAGAEAKKKQLGENEKRLGQRATQLNDKAKATEAAYQKAVDTANDVSKETFGTHLPPVIDALQTLEEERYAQAKTVLEAFHKEFRALPDSLIERAEELSKALEALDVEADLQEYADSHKSEKSEPEVFKFTPYKEPAPAAEKEEPKKEEEEKEVKAE